MKKFLLFLFTAALLLGLSACGGVTESGEGEVKIVTTLFPAYDFARQIAGEYATVTLLVPPGAEAHSFEPTSRDILRIEGCDLLFCNGGESEAWLEELLEGQDKAVPLLVMLDEVEALEEEAVEGMQSVGHDHDHGEHDHDDHDHEEHDDHDHEEETEYDEHVWTSPKNAMAICEALCARLCQIDPAHEETFRANCAAYCEELRALDAAFREVVDNGSGSCLIFADRFPVRYFVEEYGLEYYAAFPGCADDTEPSARTVAFLIDRVRDEQVPAVLVIEYSNGKMARVIAEDTGCGICRFHSCHTVSLADMEAGENYLSLMWKNVESIREALG